ncbi:homocitrate synthase/isopropylmalate synthase family protein [Calditerrivibrio nitroreducens]|uniref:homocitrate synthase/isopropylmalate synthase family protein n=2 Tax=Calditerrivibrio TaxID=545865 RepID=UPI003C70B337
MKIVLLNKYQIPIKTKLLLDVCHLVSKISGFGIEKNKPIIGANSFTHESGMHVDGVLKDPSTCEPYNPDILNLKRKITFGSTSGRVNIVFLNMLKNRFSSKKDIPMELLDDLKYAINRG